MVNFLKKLKKYSIIVIISSFILGFLLIMFPAQCIKYTALLVGCAVITLGLYAIIEYFVKKQTTLLLFLGSLVILVGIIICVKYEGILSLVILLCGIAVLASGVANLATSIKAIGIFRIFGSVSAVLSLASIVFGLIAVLNYDNLSDKIIVLIGIALLVFAITELCAYIEVLKLAKRVKQNADGYGHPDCNYETLSSHDEIDVEARIEEE